MKTPRILTSATILTAVAAANLLSAGPADAAIGDCPSGYMCLWSQPNYSGTIKKINATGSYKAIGLSTVESYYNHRSKRTWLHSTTDGSGSYVCLDPGDRASSLSGWQDNAKAVYLATITNC
ncbi:peptidase inhibitor family I36 protein [Aeromicrobium sp. 9AM]|uniref:peptidase inhibitor family I36 protein n=1 Tax=Aeromicrobium sp. 9AM TaxID=2653126 RepID=UPI0012F0CE82|nr:peptidase inhibitor family I36 protein [Aeromicrobium sp. 9AM]VXB03751.1 conserved exported hypothetical protein [Aeromicrobium sp. 9AM]